MEKAQWIWIHTEDNQDEYAEFFDSFDYSGGNLSLEISCDSNYAVYVNGKLAGYGQYADFPHYKVYDLLDITEFARHGNNQVKIVVWYYGIDTQGYYKGKPCLIYEIKRGEEILCFSCEGTRCKKSDNYVSGLKKIITVQLGYSFRYDTRERNGELKPAVKADVSFNMLHLNPVKKPKLSDTFYGKLIDEKKQIYDLGCERVGFLHIKFKAAAGELITISYGEHLSDGNVRRIIGGRDFSVELIANGSTAEYLNPFRRLGCRYLQISSQSPVEVEFVGIKETLYPVTVKEFDAGNELRQRIYDTCVRTLHLCMHEHYEDSPWREQALYTLDGRNQMLCGYYAFGEYSFARANLKLISEDNRDDGLLSICFPSKTNLAIPSFSLYYIIQMKEYAEYSRDTSLLIEYFDKLKRIINVFAKRQEEGLVPVFYGSPVYWNFYEWAEGLEGSLFTAVRKHFDLILNALFSLALKNMADICGMTGREGKEEYLSMSRQINDAVNKRFFDAGKGIYRTFEGKPHYCELGNALAVLCGAAGENIVSRICYILANEDNDLIKTTLSMTPFKYDALLKCDKRFARFILEDIDKNYSYMLQKGATTFWETIRGEADFDGAGSLCHGWSAMPVYYYHILKEHLT